MKIMVAPMSVVLPAKGPYMQCLAFCSLASEKHEVFTFAAHDAVWTDIAGIRNIRAENPKLLGFIPRWILKTVIKPFFLDGKNGRKYSAMKSFEHVQYALGLSERGYFKKDFYQTLDIFAKEKPDMVFAGRYSVLAAAVYAGIANAVMVEQSQLSDFASNPELSREARKFLRMQKLGSFDSLLDLAGCADLKLVPGTRSLSPVPYPDAVYIGPLRERAKRRDGKDKKRDLIVVYVGNNGINPQLADWLEEYLSACDLTAVIVKSGEESTGIKVRTVKSFDKECILEKTVLYIHHGGLNSCYDAITEGIPQLILKNGHFERESNADKMIKLGAGLPWNPDDSREEFFESLDRLLKSPEYVKNSLRLQKEWKDYGGWCQALAEMEKRAGVRNEG